MSKIDKGKREKDPLQLVAKQSALKGRLFHFQSKIFHDGNIHSLESLGGAAVRITCLLLAMLLLMAGPVLAVSPVNAHTIKAAVDYGKGKADISLAEFFQPWTVYEEKADIIDETAERAVLFTPFLLVAADARDRTQAGGPVTMGDVEKVLSDYNGYLIFGLTLYGPDPQFAARLAANIRQGGKTVKVHLANVPVTADKAAWASPEQKIYEAPCYLYFLAKDIAVQRPATLVVMTGDKRQRSFYFPLGEYK